MFMKRLALALAGALLFSQTALAGDLVSPDGVWLTGEQKARIRLETCGSDLCGTLQWLAKPLDPRTGMPRLDIHNPDPTLRSRAIMGLRMLEMKPVADGVWRGSIYDAEDGNTYDSSLTIEGDHLNLQGCILFGLICQTQSWTRYQQ